MLYSEREGKKLNQERTYDININMYAVIIQCCNKYKVNLTHLFKKENYHSFTERQYIIFDEIQYENRMKIKIPQLYRDIEDRIGIPENGDRYDQYALLYLIEFFATNIQDATENWNNERYRDYKWVECYDTSEIFWDFQEDINEIFSESRLLYKLTDEKKIERIIESNPLVDEIQNDIKMVRESGTKELLEEALILYKMPRNLGRNNSVEKIWDALERLKTYYKELDKKTSVNRIVTEMSKGDKNYMDLFENEFNMLTRIGNNFRIRHHETNKIDIIDERYYDYFFNRCISLISLAIKFLGENSQGM
ncbi:hypothetical protein [Abiotrophia defectiva]|uniref:hypothetical protein n=1 Tax=Abiotrophia defectiva TaxID=46125 RepID=UPI0028EE0D6D|nr:hypothetical protein [Abiotrophia defectiva]